MHAHVHTYTHMQTHIHAHMHTVAKTARYQEHIIIGPADIHSIFHCSQTESSMSLQNIGTACMLSISITLYILYIYIYIYIYNVNLDNAYTHYICTPIYA